MTAYALYEPINALKPIAEDVWVVDGPEIAMRYPYLGLKVPFPTRMTVVRLGDGELWVHSPTPLTPALREAVDALGVVRFLVAPNLLHYWWIGEWKSHYPQARAYSAPGTRERAAKRFDGFDADLGEEPPEEWRGAFRQLSVRGDFLTEVAFLHIASGTLVLTDLIENFEPERFKSRVMRWSCRLSGCCDPDGKMPIDLRSTFWRHRRAVGRSVERMLGWGPQRIVLAHGRWYPDNAGTELQRAFRWAL